MCLVNYSTSETHIHVLHITQNINCCGNYAHHKLEQRKLTLQQIPAD